MDLQTRAAALEKLSEEFMASMTKANGAYVELKQGLDRLGKDFGPPGIEVALGIMQRFVERASRFSGEYGDLNKPGN